jgi:hypothetical protein
LKKAAQKRLVRRVLGVDAANAQDLDPESLSVSFSSGKAALA